MLIKIKCLLGVEDEKKDPKINLLIENAKAYIVDYLHIEEYSIKYDPITIKMVIEDYRKLGSEAITTASAEGLSTSYKDGYGDNIMKHLKKHRKLRVL